MTTATATATDLTATPSRQGLRIALWGVQGLLAFAFGMAGFTKLTAPTAELIANGMSFVAYTPEPLVRFIGLSEVLGAVGLILPAATRLLPWLTGVAGAGLALVMLLAFGTHVVHAEYPPIVANVILGGLAAFVAWGRLVGAPIQAR